MKVWKRFFSDWKRALGTHRYARSGERLARLQAYRWSLEEKVFAISRITPTEGEDCLVIVRTCMMF